MDIKEILAHVGKQLSRTHWTREQVAGWVKQNFVSRSTYENEVVKLEVEPAVKNPPIDADSVVIWDSVAAIIGRVTFTNIKAFLKTYFDTLYVALSGAQTITGLKTFSAGLTFGSSTFGAYTQGTWPPTVEAATLGTLSATYSIRTGRYTRIGDVVFFSFFIRLDTYSAGTASGETWISLPFTASATNATMHPFAVVSNGINWPGTPIDTAAEAVPGTNIARLYANQDNSTRQYVGPGDLAAGDDIACTGFYWV